MRGYFSSVGSRPSSATPELGQLLLSRLVDTVPLAGPVLAATDALRKSGPPWM